MPPAALESACRRRPMAWTGVLARRVDGVAARGGRAPALAAV